MLTDVMGFLPEDARQHEVLGDYFDPEFLDVRAHDTADQSHTNDDECDFCSTEREPHTRLDVLDAVWEEDSLDCLYEPFVQIMELQEELFSRPKDQLLDDEHAVQQVCKAAMRIHDSEEGYESPVVWSDAEEAAHRDDREGWGEEEAAEEEEEERGAAVRRKAAAKRGRRLKRR
ncbi:hypothetical protein GPECTOR_5g428 [Gonium pectorale]|uniref:Uncharacterized protein n=1 Tax=Gonium pectorale TaxID=33097 RepID=A0A150GWS3_GONPE|nr:hypothetical protein GPECTOR_5g428 [Gonium pectorale]|eukprot:KXZ54346.1 hypothetical protein GPECTOR_5g428 [Gonium pectorale]